MVPILYINLSNRPDRREFMERQLAALGLAGERVEAVTAGEVPQPLLDYHLQPRPVRRCAASELACGLSHAAVWQLIVDRGYPAAIVLEDDALLSPALVPFTQPGLLASLDADVIKLETWQKDVRLGSPISRIGSVGVHPLASAHLGCAAYLISREMARKSLAHRKLHTMPVDHFLFTEVGPNLSGGRILQANPGPAVQLNKHNAESELGQSDIRHDRLATRRQLGRGDGDRAWMQRWIGLRHVLRMWLRDPGAMLRPSAAVAFAGSSLPEADISEKSRRPVRR